MKKKQIENFELHVGDLAITFSYRDNVKLIEVAKINEPDTRALFTYPEIKLWNSNFPEEELSYITKKVISSVKYLKGRR